VFCALGTTIGKAGSQEAFRKVDFGYPKRLADLALQAGARQFLLVSSVGADPKSRNFYLRVKGELEEALNAMPFDAVHAFRPSFLIGDRAEKRAGETIAVPIARVLGSLLVGVLRKYRAISGDTVAAAMVGAARESRSGRWVYHYDEMRRLAGAEPGSK
jgi:uncharacterized protein YbjT (DUF2867 family)